MCVVGDLYCTSMEGEVIPGLLGYVPHHRQHLLEVDMGKTEDESLFWKNRTTWWEICPGFHGMNDVGHGSGPMGFSRPRTYNAECYAQIDGKKCQNKGRCVVRRGLK